MIVDSIAAQEWHCFRSITVDFSRIRVASVVGYIEGRPGKSNGAGKSVLLVCVPYALFNWDDHDDIQRLGAKSDTFVEIKVQHRGRAARVKRGFKIKRDGTPGPGFLEFDLDGVPQKGNIDELNAQIIEFVGCDEGVYLATTFFAQGAADQFVKTTAGKRKEILAELLGLEMYEVARKIADKEAAEIEASIIEIVRQRDLEVLGASSARERVSLLMSQDLDATIRGIDKRLEGLAALQADYEVSRMGITQFEDEIRPSIDEHARAVNALTAASTSLRSARTLLTNAEASKDSRRRQLVADYQSRMARIRKIDTLRIMLSDYEIAIAAQEAILASITVGDRKMQEEARDEANREIGKSDAAITVAQRALLRLDTTGPVCPTCEQKVGPEHRAKHKEEYQATIASHQSIVQNSRSDRATADEAIKVIDEAKRKISAANLELAALRPAKVTTAKELAEAEALAADNEKIITASKTELDAFDANISTLKTQVSEAEDGERQAQTVVDEARQRMEDAQSAIDPEAKRVMAALHARIIENIRTTKVNRENAQSDIRALSEATAKLAQHEQRINAFDQQRIQKDFDKEVRTFLAKGFSKNGIPMLVMENVVAEIERGTVEILEVLDSPYRVRFRTSTDSGRETILIEVETREGTRGIGSFSGGQITEINLAVRLALSEVLARRADVSFQSIFLDEVMAALDRPARDCFLRVVNLMRRSFKQVFVISHHEEIRDVLESSIVVTLRPDGSTVEVAA